MTNAVKLSHPPVEVSAADFRTAAGRLPKMKRAPAGARSSMPRDTILSPGDNGITVETPVVASLVPSKPVWQITASVDARRLLAVCDSFKKIGAYKSPADTFLLSVQDGELRVKFRTTTLSIPIL